MNKVLICNSILAFPTLSDNLNLRIFTCVYVFKPPMLVFLRRNLNQDFKKRIFTIRNPAQKKRELFNEAIVL